MRKTVIGTLLPLVVGTVLSVSPEIRAEVTYLGGPGLPNVQVENLYLGSAWNTKAGQEWVGKLEAFTGYLIKSPYMDALANAGYGVGRGQTFQGRVIPTALDPKQWLTDAAIRNVVQTAINQGALQPEKNCLYIVFVEGGIAVQGADGSTSIKNFLGYHSYFVGKDKAGRQAYIPYAVVTLPGAPNPTSKGFPNDFDRVTSTASHEIAEAVTDPLMNGWFDGTQEVGDLADGNFQYLDGYYVQLIANKKDQPMRLSNDKIYTWKDFP